LYYFSLKESRECVKLIFPIGNEEAARYSPVPGEAHMLFELVTPEKVILKQEIDELQVLTPKGQIAILPHHTQLLTKVLPGEMVVKIGGKEEFLAVTGGFLEVRDNTITLLADYAIRSHEIEVEKALKARDRAQEVLKKRKEAISDRDLAMAEGELRRSILELHVANRRRKQRV
jgi:F-type H+-transporting ATPase subunit epsilon